MIVSSAIRTVEPQGRIVPDRRLTFMEDYSNYETVNSDISG
jgi:hypothetical protein